jgi:hypothetical protein
MADPRLTLVDTLIFLLAMCLPVSSKKLHIEVPLRMEWCSTSIGGSIPNAQPSQHRFIAA